MCVRAQWSDKTKLCTSYFLGMFVCVCFTEIHRVLIMNCLLPYFNLVMGRISQIRFCIPVSLFLSHILTRDQFMYMDSQSESVHFPMLNVSRIVAWLFAFVFFSFHCIFLFFLLSVVLCTHISLSCLRIST